jgi:hypothetical protein
MGAVRNKNGIFINSDLFREAGLKFIKDKKYCDARPGTIEFENFWDEEVRRCKFGYEVGGAKITGRHYFYLNYCPIKKTNLTDENKFSRKVNKTFEVPDFWDGDYDYFWMLDISEYGLPKEVLEKGEEACKKWVEQLHLSNKVLYYLGGKSMIVAKARRRGFSYKNSAVVCWEYTFLPKSNTMIAAFDKKYLFSQIGIFPKIVDMLNHLNENCPAFKRTRLVNKIADGNLKSGFIEYQEDGTEIIKGMQSIIACVSFMDNPDAGRGFDGNKIVVEEAGTFANWSDSYSAMEPSIKDGDYYTGTMIVFGTGGDMEGGTIDFAEMFYNPDNYNMMPFVNVWDQENLSDNTCGYYFPMYQNYLGAYDKNGNSDIVKAKELLTKQRELKKIKAKSPDEYKRHCTEYSWSPEETFQIIGGNLFPTEELKKQLAKVENTKELNGVTGKMILKDGLPYFEPHLNLKPLEYKNNSNDLEGCIQIWESPIDNPAFGFYTAGLDPYGVDQTTDSDSLGSMFIYKRYVIGQETYNFPVAEYTARPKAGFKEYYDQCILLLKYYNASCLYEANINAPKTHFEHKHCLYLLSKTPSILKSTERQNENNYGLKMTAGVKAEIIVYLNDWLREEYAEGHLNLEKIYSKGLLQELIRFNKEGNFDRFISFSLALVRAIELTRIISQEKKKSTTSTLFRNPLFQK